MKWITLKDFQCLLPAFFQHKTERGANAQCTANGYGLAMCFYDVLNYGKAQARTANFTATATVGTIETLEDAW